MVGWPSIKLSLLGKGDLHIGKIPCTVLLSWPGCLACILWQCDIFLFFQSYSLQHILQMAPEDIVKVSKMLLQKRSYKVCRNNSKSVGEGRSDIKY